MKNEVVLLKKKKIWHHDTMAPTKQTIRSKPLSTLPFGLSGIVYLGLYYPMCPFPLNDTMEAEAILTDISNR